VKKEGEPQPTPLTIETVAEIAVEVLLRDGYHRPTLIVEGSKASRVLQLSQVPPTHEERAAQMLTVGLLLREQGELGRLKQVYFVTEAWLSEQNDLQAPRPSQDPNRKEVLVVSGFQVSGARRQVALYEMVRDARGQFRELKPFQAPHDPDNVYTPLLDAFVFGYRRGL
jgi:hypothetical protein